MHDVAFVDMVCDCFLRGIQLQHQAPSAVEQMYGKFLAVARQHAGKTISGQHSTIKIGPISAAPRSAWDKGYLHDGCLCFRHSL